jgi:cytoskeletal protein CcmA (bactofilin family)
MEHETNSDDLTKSSTGSMREKTMIASSFSIKGDLVAQEDTLIQGRVDGSILVEKHTVQIGKEGRVSGKILARKIVVDGRTDGQLNATETVVLRKNAEVEGEILSPQVVMEEGCKFNGKVKMEVGTTSGRSK